MTTRKPSQARRSLTINRAPVLTLWAAVVAERLGFNRKEALTLGRAVAGLNAYSKGVRLGLFHPAPREVREKRRKMRDREAVSVDLLNRAVPAKQTPEGLRALSRNRPIDPAGVERYLESKFGEALADAREAMSLLARSLPPAQLAGAAYQLYEKFRPAVPSGTRGWGAAGKLSLDKIRKLAER